MNNTQKHIVGSCRWITQFDSKREAFELQSKISKWSNYQMLRELDWVFNEVCPDDKIMIIEKLELDLGAILYHDFFQELPERFSEKLREALHSMIHASGKTESNLRIETQDQGYFDTLQYFLQFGYVMNGLNQGENLHNIVELLLANHKVRAVQMLRELLKEETIRKRIAWQFKDEIITKIIKELEPNNYDYIIDFTDQVTLIQRKENILNTSLSDFKKNLWFWVFNYLFVERGTMFNKIAFVQSTMMQMARHFNIAYEYLFELIESAVDTIDHYKKGEFLSILRILYKQNKKTTVRLKTSQKEIDQYWSELSQFLNDTSTRVLSEKKRYFNELIQNLNRQNQSQFKDVISKAVTNEQHWLDIIKDLTDASLEVVFRTLHPSQGDVIYAQAKALKQLKIEKDFKMSSEELINIAISYAVQSRSQSHTSKLFLKYVIQKLEAKNSTAKEVFFNRLIDDEVQMEKSQELFEIIGAFELLHKEELQQKQTSLTKSRLSQLIKEHSSPRHQKELAIWIEERPQKVWELLRKDGKLFQRTIEKVESKQVAILFQHFGSNSQRIVKKIKQLLKEVGQDFSDRQMMVAALEVIKKYGSTNESLFVTELIQRLIWKSSSLVTKEEVIAVIHQLKEYTKVKSFFKEFKPQIFSKEQRHKTLFEVCLDEIRKGALTKKDILRKIAALIREKAIHSKSLEVQEGKLLAYIFEKKTIDKAMILNEIKANISQYHPNVSPNELDIILKEIYWESLVAYEVHQGKVSQWKLLFKEKIAKKFPKVFHATSSKNKVDFSKVASITLKHLEESPEEINAWIRSSNDENSILQVLSKELLPHEFFGLMRPVMDTSTRTYFDAFLSMYLVMKTKVKHQEIEQLESSFWEYGIQLIRGKKPDILFRKLINTVIEKLNLNPYFDQNELVEEFVKIGLHEYIHIEYERTTSNIEQSNRLKKYLKYNQVEDLIESLLKHDEVPAWFDNSSRYTPISLWQEIIKSQLHNLTQVLRKDQRYIHVFESVAPKIKFIETLEKRYVHQGTALNHTAQLYQLLGTISQQDISAEEWQGALMRIVLRSWLHSNWKPLTESQLWMELMWEINRSTPITQKQFIRIVASIKNALPTPLVTTLKYLEYAKEAHNSKPIQFMKKTTVGIPVRNAGLVILNTYFKILFDRLGLLNGNEFLDEEAQLKAIHYLQYIVTGLTETEESLLVLNKILCGIDIEKPIKESIEMNPKEKTLIDGMIESSIAYWDSIGTTSVEGFRGNWLVRDGVLTEEEDKWELTVEKRSYDILMQKSPFSFSIIKLPWMKKPLHVTWPF